jgi:hypothetical protein
MAISVILGALYPKRTSPQTVRADPPRVISHLTFSAKPSEAALEFRKRLADAAL